MFFFLEILAPEERAVFLGHFRLSVSSPSPSAYCKCERGCVAILDIRNLASALQFFGRNSFRFLSTKRAIRMSGKTLQVLGKMEKIDVQ